MELPRLLNEKEAELVEAFTTAAERIAESTGVVVFDINAISTEAGIELRHLPKAGILIQAIWVSFLNVLRSHLPKSELKYKSLPDFLKSYRGQFDDCSPTEMQNLMDTANWMNILARFIPAKKNKGFFMAVVPKLIEGWMTNYVTGSGQKRTTADRVKIFETEGGISAASYKRKSRTNVIPNGIKKPKKQKNEGLSDPHKYEEVDTDSTDPLTPVLYDGTDHIALPVHVHSSPFSSASSYFSAFVVDKNNGEVSAKAVEV